MRMKKVFVWMLVLLLPLMFLACSGKGSGSGASSSSTSTSTSGSGDTSTTTAPNSLIVTSKVSVVDAKLSSSVAAVASLKILSFKVAAADFSTTSDYNTDKTSVYVEERSAKQFDTINNILCMFGQTKYEVMLNKGAYVALVDQNLCDSGKSSASSAGTQSQNQSSSGSMPNYDTFTVDASRADNNSPEYLNVWIHQAAEGNNSEQLIYASMVITESTGDTNPYGIFKMNFAGYNASSGVADVTAMRFSGTLQAVRDAATGKILLQYINRDNGNGQDQTQITLDRAADGSQGAGTIVAASVESGVTSTIEYNIAYNTNNFFRQDLLSPGSPTYCMNRLDYSESAWSYGLYDTNGARVQTNAGFSITFGSSGQSQGFIGYWGLWTNDNSTLNSGDTVNKVDSSTNTSVPYTIFKAGGKLQKVVKKSLTLNDIKNLPISYSEYLSSGTSGTQYQVVWDGVQFSKTAYMVCDSSSTNCTWNNLASPYAAIDLTQLQSGTINFWSDSGSLMVQLANCSAYACSNTACSTSCSLPQPTDLAVVFYQQTVVSPGDVVPQVLACYDSCPNPAALTTSNPYFTTSYMYSSGTPTRYDYSFNASIQGQDPMVLKLGSNPVVLSGTNTSYSNGIQSGTFFDPAATVTDAKDPNYGKTYLQLLACDAPMTGMCTWKASSSLPVFYTWTTSLDTWNQFIGVYDSTGTFVKFDPPLQVQYQDISSGTKYQLEYDGFGQLSGIPGKCVNEDTGANANCADSMSSTAIRWVPSFTIPQVQADGVTLTTVTDSNNNQYYVKPLSIEQRMNQDTSVAGLANCSTLATGLTPYALPEMSIWSDPTSPEPTPANSAPAVIGGVVQ